MPEVERNYTGRLLYALIAMLALAQSGCLLALAGVAGGAAATGYFYCKGRINRDYPAQLPDVRNAVHAALLDLRFGDVTEETKDGKATFVTRTTNGKKVHIYLDSLSSPIPAEGVMTRVAIRVATFGDEGVATRIFDQVAWRLGHPAPVAAVPPAPIRPASFQTTEPKLAPAK